MTTNRCKANISFYQVASVVSCFLAITLESGLGSLYGVLYTYMKAPLDFTDQELTWIGALMTGTFGTISPFSSLLLETIGLRTTCCIGGMIIFASFVIGSQLTNLYALYVFLGLLPGVGTSFTYTAGTVQVANMFTKRLPLALGIGQAASGVGVFLLPLITAWCADAYGWQGGTLILGAVLLHDVLAGRLIKAQHVKKVSEGKENGETRLINAKEHLLEYKEFLLQRSFILYCLTLILNGSSYHLKSVFAPDYILTSMPNITKPEAAMVISVMGIGNVVGRVTFCGISIVSKMAALYGMTIATLTMAVCLTSVLFCQSLPGFTAVGFVYGVGQGGWAALLTLVCVLLFDLKRLAKSTGVALFFIGVGFLVGPPLHRFAAEVFGRDDLPFYTGLCVFSLSFLIFLCILIQVSCTKKTNEDKSGMDMQSIRL